MGVKGLYSIITSEPKRFGERLVFNQETNVDIYIDAPSLLHHLIDIFTNSDIGYSAENKIKRIKRSLSIYSLPHHFEKVLRCEDKNLKLSSSTRQHIFPVSPKCIYELTIAFCISLQESIGPKSNIHFVFDGVASVYKVEQQIERLKKVAIDIDHQIRKFKSIKGSCNQNMGNYYNENPHLFAEDAMIAAVKTLQQERQCKNIIIHLHYAPWEAEGYIAQLIHDNQYVKSVKSNDHLQPQTIIFSNDTDFLVFPIVQGIVPLHSLEYDYYSYIRKNDNIIIKTQDGKEGNNIKWTMQGWLYKREKLMNSFGLENKFAPNDAAVSDLLITSTIAALAGCDYKLNGKFQNSINLARQKIVQSDIGGLRQKDRNNPSAKDTITAVIRFVQHFVSRYSLVDTQADVNGDSDNDSHVEYWLTKLVERIVVVEQNSSLLRKKKKSKNHLRSVKQIEQDQITLVHAILLIRDIYNDNCSHSSLSILEYQDPQTSLRWSQELRRLMRYSTIFCKPILEVYTQPHESNTDENLVKSSFQCRSHSVWIDEIFVKCRLRIYSLIQCSLDRTNDITEYFQAKTRNVLDIASNVVNIEMDIKSCQGFLSSCQSTMQVSDILSYIFFGLNHRGCELNFTFINHFINGTILQLNGSVLLLLAASFLSRRDAIFLFLMSSYSNLDDLVNMKFDGLVNDDSLNDDYIDAQSRIEVAIFHAKIGIETTLCVTTQLEKNEGFRYLSIHNDLMREVLISCLDFVHKPFCQNATIQLMWSKVSSSIDYEGQSKSLEDNLLTTVTVLNSEFKHVDTDDILKRSLIQLWKHYELFIKNVQ